jgi:hypothetical protein
MQQARANWSIEVKDGKVKSMVGNCSEDQNG